MDLDTNQLCPGGTGKKIKFCCKDLTRELDKIVRLMEGGQRKAAVDTIDRTLAAQGDRPCLYALKTEVLRESGDAEGAKAAMSAFAEKFADNPAALAEGAIAKLDAGNIVEAIDQLQTAMELSGDSVDSKVYAAWGFAARALLLDGNVPAARAHLVMQIELTQGRDAAPVELLGQIDRAPYAPVVLKLIFDCEDQAPEGADWQDELTAAVDRANRGEWRRALQMHQALVEKHPESAVIRRNIAVLTTKLGDRHAAAKAWRDFAAVAPGWDDRVEVEALAQLLEKVDEEDQLDDLKITYPVHDMDRLVEKFLSDPRAVAYPGDMRELVGDDETPPKCAFTLLDRAAQPESGQEITVDTVPNVLGEVIVFGRRTDREARLEFDTLRGERFDEARRTLADVAGDSIGPPESEEVVAKVSRVASVLSWQWRFPPDMPAERRQELLEQKRRSLLFESWPEIPRAIFDGKTARQAAAEGPFRVRAAAAVLLLELAGEQAGWNVDFNELRDTLGLPRREPIDPSTVDIRRLPLTRIPFLQVDRLSDDELVTVFRRAAAFNYMRPLEMLGREALRRDSLGENKLDKAQVHHLLSQVVSDPKEAIEHLRKCREMLTKRGESPAMLLIEEFRLRMATGEGLEEIDSIFQRLRLHHFQEPGVAQALYQTLMEFGLMTPDGRMGAAINPSQVGEAAPQAQAAPQPDAGKLWTPGAPSGGEKKSSLWTPGMD